MKKKQTNKQNVETNWVLVIIITFIVGMFVGVFAGPLLVPTASSPSEMDHDHTHNLEHIHEHGHEPIAVDPTLPLPSVEVIIHDIEGEKGHNLEIVYTNFQVTPDNVGQEAVQGQGHAHLYVDGDKITRIYGNWFYLAEMDPGQYEVRVTLNADDHSEWTINGVPVESRKVLTVEE